MRSAATWNKNADTQASRRAVSVCRVAWLSTDVHKFDAPRPMIRLPAYNQPRPPTGATPRTRHPSAQEQAVATIAG